MRFARCASSPMRPVIQHRTWVAPRSPPRRPRARAGCPLQLDLLRNVGPGLGARRTRKAAGQREPGHRRRADDSAPPDVVRPSAPARLHPSCRTVVCPAGQYCDPTSLGCVSGQAAGATCTFNAACDPSIVCRTGICGAPLPDQSACMEDTDCASGACLPIGGQTSGFGMRGAPARRLALHGRRRMPERRVQLRQLRRDLWRPLLRRLGLRGACVVKMSIVEPPARRAATWRWGMSPMKAVRLLACGSLWSLILALPSTAGHGRDRGRLGLELELRAGSSDHHQPHHPYQDHDGAGALPPVTSTMGPLFLWPGLSNPTSDLIQTTMDAWGDNASYCGATAGQWCVEASVFGSFGQRNGPASPSTPTTTSPSSTSWGRTTTPGPRP